MTSPRVNYTPELGAEICERLAEGESLNSICKDEHMPSKSTVVRWVSDPKHPLSEHYARAREVGYQLLADEIIEISDTPMIGRKTKIGPNGTEETEGDMIEHRRLQVDSRKWMLSKMLPKIYGDRVQVDQQIGFTQEFESFMRELKGVRDAKVIDAGVAEAGTQVASLPVPFRSGGLVSDHGGDLDPVGSGDASA